MGVPFDALVLTINSRQNKEGVSMGIQKKLKGLLWGLYVVALGVALVVNAVTPGALPLARLFLGLFFVVWGLTVIIGGRWRPDNGAKRKHT